MKNMQLEETLVPQYPVASYWRRVAAASLDFIIYLTIVSLVVTIDGFIFSGILALAQIGTTSAIVASIILSAPTLLILVASPFIYPIMCVNMTANSGYTWGKWIMGLRVASYKGDLISWGDSFIRQLFITLWWLAVLIPVVGWTVLILAIISPVLDKTGKMRAWHDVAARDVVIQFRRASQQ